MQNNDHDYTIERVLLVVTVIAFIGFLIRSLYTGEDIPTGWSYLIGMSWGGLLGIRELISRPKGGGKNGPNSG